MRTVFHWAVVSQNRIKLGEQWESPIMTQTTTSLWKLTGCYCLVKRSFCCTTLLSSKVIVPFFFFKLKHWFCKVKNECFRCYFLRPYISVLAVPPEERINNDKYWLGSPAEFHVQRRWECLIGSYCAPSKTVDCLIYTHTLKWLHD